mgnify:CR=1 FL=1
MSDWQKTLRDDSISTLAQLRAYVAERFGEEAADFGTAENPTAVGTYDFTELQIDLEVYDLKHLNAIISQLTAMFALLHNGLIDRRPAIIARRAGWVVGATR